VVRRARSCFLVEISCNFYGDVVHVTHRRVVCPSILYVFFSFRRDSDENNDYPDAPDSEGWGSSHLTTHKPESRAKGE